MKTQAGEQLQASLGKRIAELRTKQGITQERFAAENGFDRMTIALIETGRRWPRADSLSRIANGLKVDVDTLFKGIKVG